MDRPVSDDDLRRTHAALRITTPLCDLCEPARRALAIVAADHAQRAARRAAANPVDLKRRAAGDFED